MSRTATPRKWIFALVAAMVALPAAAGVSPAEGPVETCFGEPVTEVGTPGHDDIELSSSDEPEVVNGLGGDDSISGGDAADRLCGGPGIDEVYGNRGKDRINTGSGRDYGNGEEGADKVQGGGGKDHGDTTWRVGTPDESGFGAGVDGGSGDDRISGGDGDDGIRGEDGDDVIRGNAGTDRCAGGPGSDDVDCEKPFVE